MLFPYTQTTTFSLTTDHNQTDGGGLGETETPIRAPSSGAAASSPLLVLPIPHYSTVAERVKVFCRKSFGSKGLGRAGRAPAAVSPLLFTTYVDFTA